MGSIIDNRHRLALCANCFLYNYVCVVYVHLVVIALWCLVCQIYIYLRLGNHMYIVFNLVFFFDLVSIWNLDRCFLIITLISIRDHLFKYKTFFKLQGHTINLFHQTCITIHYNHQVPTMWSYDFISLPTWEETIDRNLWIRVTSPYGLGILYPSAFYTLQNH